MAFEPTPSGPGRTILTENLDRKSRYFWIPDQVRDDDA
jgi:hypothetical protein